MNFNRLAAAALFVLLALGCAGTGTKKSMTADEMLTVIVTETGGKCNLAMTGHMCEITMVPDEKGVIAVMVSTSTGHSGDGIEEAVMFDWNPKLDTVKRVKQRRTGH